MPPVTPPVILPFSPACRASEAALEGTQVDLRRTDLVASIGLVRLPPLILACPDETDSLAPALAFPHSSLPLNAPTNRPAPSRSPRLSTRSLSSPSTQPPRVPSTSQATTCLSVSPTTARLRPDSTASPLADIPLSAHFSPSSHSHRRPAFSLRRTFDSFAPVASRSHSAFVRSDLARLSKRATDRVAKRNERGSSLAQDRDEVTRERKEVGGKEKMPCICVRDGEGGTTSGRLEGREGDEDSGSGDGRWVSVTRKDKEDEREMGRVKRLGAMRVRKTDSRENGCQPKARSGWVRLSRLGGPVDVEEGNLGSAACVGEVKLDGSD